MTCEAAHTVSQHLHTLLYPQAKALWRYRWKLREASGGKGRVRVSRLVCNSFRLRTSENGRGPHALTGHAPRARGAGSIGGRFFRLFAPPFRKSVTAFRVYTVFYELDHPSLYAPRSMSQALNSHRPPD